LYFGKPFLDEIIFNLTFVTWWAYEWVIALIAMAIFLMIPVIIGLYIYQRKPA
jgi:hypothetical protein